MAITPARFQIPHIDPNQLTPTVTANEGLNAIDTGINATIDVDVNAGGTITLANTDWQDNFNFNLRGDLGSPDGPLADFILEVPSGSPGFFLVSNSTSFNCEVRTAGIGSPQVSFTIAAGDSVFCYSDGTDVVAGQGADGADGAPGAPGTDGTDGTSAVNAQDYDVWFPGSPTSSQMIRRFIFTRQTTFAAEMSGSQGYAGVVATSQTDFEIYHGDSASPSPILVATMTFAAGAERATFVTAGSPTESFTVAEGDFLEIRAPASADATLADLSIRLRGNGLANPWELIERQEITSSVASVDFSFNETLYDEFELIVSELVPQNDSTKMYLRVSVNGGVSYVSAADYSWAGRRIGASPSGADQGSGGSPQANQIDLDGASTGVSGNAAGEASNSVIRCFGLGGSRFSVFSYSSHYATASAALAHLVIGTGVYEDATPVNGLQILMSEGNITSGVFTLMGKRKA